MTTLDKNGKELQTGEQVHFEIDGRPYTGVIHSLIRRDHEPAIMTIVQLYLPATQVSKDATEPKNQKTEHVARQPRPDEPTPKKGPR